MSNTGSVPSGGPPPEAKIVELLLAQVASRLVFVAASLNLPDYLADGAKTAEELAPLTGTHAPALYRVMRALAGLGVFAEDAEHRFTLCPLGAVLRSGSPTHAMAMILGGEIFQRSYNDIMYSVQTGNTAFEHSFGVPVFHYLSAHPVEASLFAQTMVGFHGMEPPAVAAAYDFSKFGTIADVGGSTGNLLTTILAKHAGPRGILFDLPNVVHEAPALIEQRGLKDRVRIEAGSFFETVPEGADAYVMSHVIHDWNHEQCMTILENCRRAMKGKGHLLLVEMVLPEANVMHPGKMLDMVMLTIPGGEERTAAQYGALLDQAGFKMTRTVPTASPVTLVEAVPKA